MQLLVRKTRLGLGMEPPGTRWSAWSWAGRRGRAVPSDAGCVPLYQSSHSTSCPLIHLFGPGVVNCVLGAVLLE